MCHARWNDRFQISLPGDGMTGYGAKLTRRFAIGNVRYPILRPERRLSGVSNKADMMTGPCAVMICPLLVGEIWPLSGEKGSFNEVWFC